MPSKTPLICVPICERTLSRLERAIKAAEVAADIIEIRVDCVDVTEHEAVVRNLSELCKNCSKPTIVTYRPAEQGGRRELGVSERLNFWGSNRSDGPAFFDLEPDIANLISTNPSDWSRVICSHHDFATTPSNLETIYERLAKIPARILKIAVHAEDAVDCIPLFRLLERALEEGREFIPIAMGTAGVATRILGPSRGAFLTYAILGKDSGTAPGQLTAQELRETYRIQKLTRDSEIFGVVGQPISQSLSPYVHNAAFAETGSNSVYIPFEVRDLASFMKRMVHPGTREIDWNLRGLSVTAPHKVAVMDHLDWIEPEAKEIGAVNTILVDGEGARGFNTDADGFLQALHTQTNSVEGMRCAVIGTGGAARAAIFALVKEGADVAVFARTQTRGDELAAKFKVSSHALANSNFEEFDLVVNATNMGSLG